ncbi:hypothetical protein [Streptomyces sp. NBC_01013]|uniref:hypothetical protein n=1 Tax=Streptomyces sp. NBC_01013 TaxID=2903718 RepID=UPI003864607D|nr:hypothetical protein OG538_32215 [Streptomyces sp. NBC_01013]
MDPVVLAAGTALVSAMATDAWLQSKAATVAMWRRVRPDHGDDVGAELDALRGQVLAARDADDEETEQALAGVWRMRFQQALAETPGLAAELRLLLDDHLGPALSRSEQTREAPVVMKAEARDNSRVFLAGRDQHITGA